MVPQRIRQLRLKSDYFDMLKIQNQSYVSWEATKGTAPYIEEYVLTVNVKTYYAPGKTMSRCKIRITLPMDYPNSKPDTKMISTPLVYHPHWFVGGGYCCGNWRMSESLLQYVRRMIMTLQNEPEVINPQSPANREAMDWYLRNKDNKRLFPSDDIKLTQKKSGFVVKKKTI